MSGAVYPPTDEPWPGRDLEWAPSQWDISVRDEANTLVSYTGGILREAIANGTRTTIGGVGGVKTHPGHRGVGHATAGLDAAHALLDSLGADFGLLVCDEGLIPYYTKLGWQVFDGELRTRRWGEETTFTFNRIMVREVRNLPPTHGWVDLCGPPW